MRAKRGYAKEVTLLKQEYRELRCDQDFWIIRHVAVDIHGAQPPELVKSETRLKEIAIRLREITTGELDQINEG